MQDAVGILVPRCTFGAWEPANRQPYPSPKGLVRSANLWRVARKSLGGNGGFPRVPRCVRSVAL